MKNIEGILIEPVGCLADFPSAPFHEIATRFYGRKGKASKSGSRSYWHLLNLIESAAHTAEHPIAPDQRLEIERLEGQAAAEAYIYEDVVPAMHEIAALNLKIAICSSLSAQALRCFLDRLSFTGIPLCSVTSRDDAGAIKSGALAHSVRDCGLDAGQFIFLTDTAEGIRTANQAGVHPVLMMNDADEARRLSMHQPSGGIVSLHELPDLIRFVRANAG